MCLSRINLLILDECHHAKKGTKAPYVLLMSKYDPHAEQKPRVLGMTVSGPSLLIPVLIQGVQWVTQQWLRASPHALEQVRHCYLTFLPLVFLQGDGRCL